MKDDIKRRLIEHEMKSERIRNNLFNGIIFALLGFSIGLAIAIFRYLLIKAGVVY